MKEQKRLIKGIALFALILCGGLTIICSGGGSDTITATPDNSFTVVVFSDVHFNPLYNVTGPLFQALDAADASQWAGIFQKSGITVPSAGGTDTNYPLLMLALASIKQNLGTSPLIIFTGDILGHYLAEQYFTQKKVTTPTPQDIAAMKAFTKKTVTFFMQQVRSSVGNIPVMFALGNADSYWGLGPDNSFLSHTAELYYSLFLNGIVDHQTFISTYTSGGYYSAEPAGTNLMVIGLNTFEFSPSFAGTTSDAVTAELNWFDSTLASAQTSGKKVWLLMHVPPGADKYSTAQAADARGHITKPTMMWDQTYQTMFLQIISKYQGVITHTLTAHTHMDEYRIMSPGNVADTTPGITPYFGNNPAYKIFTFSSNTLKAIDYTSLNYDLGTMPTQFNNYYTFSTAYSMLGFLSDSLTQLYPQLFTNNTFQGFYWGSYFSGHNYSVPVGNEFYQITSTTWPVYWCGIKHMDEQGLIVCVNFYPY
ncbi:MAG: hypothetical protein C0392_09845 [Syntrophus sp. (in: bacteria)]|nr:hypothetical protein [Syntrophus sp. (in: bacteria)]